MGYLGAKFDIVVIGGGPAGSSAAKTAAEKGARVLLLEENVSRNKAIRCTGLISVRAFKEAGASTDCILRRICGAFVYAPDGRHLSIDGQDTKAFVIDRGKFDQDLLSKAIDTGVQVRTGAKAVGLEANNLVKLQEEGKQRIVEAKVIIGADGLPSKVARWSNLPSPQKLLPAIQAVVPYEPKREDFVEVFLGREIAPNFFAWAVPASRSLARIGLATDKPRSLRLFLNRLLDGRFSKEIIEMGLGTIPIGPAASTVTDHVLLVGAAAGQAKPTSGGGIYTGILCAKIAGEVAAKCALNGDTSARALLEYEKRWRDLLEKELFFGMEAHKIWCRLSDADLNKIFALLDSPKILRVFTQYGDIDYPSILAKEFIKIPQIWGGLLSIIPAKEVLTGIRRLLV